MTNGNRDLLVETCRQIAELMIWGDQNDETFFDFFAEKRVLAKFVEILSQPKGRSGTLAAQLLQSLSIMLQNIRQETSVYFLLSNHYVNELIRLDLDFSDEEVLAYYISFLKTLSLKLNVSTVQFFFQPASDSSPASFPLFTRAIEFARHPESMVRAAVRTLTLNVLSIPDQSVREFVLSDGPSSFLDDVVTALQLQTVALHRCLRGEEKSGEHIDSAVAELGDLLCYCSDALQFDFSKLRSKLASKLWFDFLEPIVLRSVASASDDPLPSSSFPAEQPLPSSATPSPSGKADEERDRNDAEGEGEDDAGANGDKAANEPASIRPSVANGEHEQEHPIGATAALYVLSRALLSLRERHLSNALAAALVSSNHSTEAEDNLRRIVDDGESGKQEWRELRESCWNGLLHCANKGHDGMAYAAVIAIVALVKNREVEDGLLKRAGVIPSKHQRTPSLEEGIDSVPAYKGHQSRLANVEPGRSQDASKESSPGQGAGNRREELSRALIACLKRPTIGAHSAWAAAWMLRTLLPSGSHLRRGEERALQSACDLVASRVESHLEGIWGDAVIPVVEREWTKARQAMQVPNLNDDTVALLIRSESAKAGAPDDQKATLPIRPSTSGGLPEFEAAENLAACTLSRSRCLMALHMARDSIFSGAMEHSPPLEKPHQGEILPASSVLEGAEIDVATRDSFQCRVAFERGRERAVCLCSACAAVPGCEWAVTTLLVLAEPLPSNPSKAVIRSSAPACGAQPFVDKAHPRWLHMRVRSSPQALLEHASYPGRKRLVDGRWTLAFQDEEAASKARGFADSCAQSSLTALLHVASPLLRGARGEE